MASKRDLKTIRMHTFVVHYGRRGVVSRYLDHREGQKERGKRRTHNEHSGIFVLALIVGTLQGLKFLYSSLRHCLGSVSRRRGVIVYKFTLSINSINMENPWFATVLQGICQNRER